MVFKYLTFIPDDNYLNTRPGSPPAFPPSSSEASPQTCHGCIGVTSRFGELHRFRDGGAMVEMPHRNGSAGKASRRNSKRSPVNTVIRKEGKEKKKKKGIRNGPSSSHPPPPQSPLWSSVAFTFPDGDCSLERSTVLQHKGPLVSCDIPRALPINIDEIPTAAVFPAMLLDTSSPIIQPIRTTNFNQILFEELRITKEVFFSAHSIEPLVGTVGSGARALLGNGNDTSLTSASEVDSFRDCDGDDECVSESSDSGEVERNMQMRSADSTPCRPSSNNLSQREEDSDNEMPQHVRIPSPVTFRDPDSDDICDEESDFDEVDSFPVKQKAENNGKKGSCYRCFKGNRFTEKEVCIVCGAKYCQNCVLRAMGSMPEGRKCVTCIGFRIDEINRSNLGKCSRMLKWLLPESEIKQIMSSEVLCPANEIPPNLVYVNDEPLDHEELLLLRGCPNPPKKLRPGYYWYDKVAGFWGGAETMPNNRCPVKCWGFH